MTNGHTCQQAHRLLRNEREAASVKADVRKLDSSLCNALREIGRELTDIRKWMQRLDRKMARAR